jgi:hypothetical protein
MIRQISKDRRSDRWPRNGPDDAARMVETKELLKKINVFVLYQIRGITVNQKNPDFAGAKEFS